MKAPVTVAITGAAGQIGYAIAFRIASGAMLGPDQPLRLRLLEIPQVLPSLRGVAMELQDCAFPLLSEVSCDIDSDAAFDGVDYALLIGAFPRGPGMERAELLERNAGIFSVQGRALNDNAAKDAKILVVGNPANTNALIAMRHAPDLSPSQFSAMTRLDHNRAVGALAAHLNAPTSAVRRVCIWGNHSASQYPDLHHATVGGEAALSQIDETWYRDTFIPLVQKRGAEVIATRGASSAASAANAAIDHMRDWALGTEDGDWTSMGVLSDGNDYGVPEGLIYSFPVVCEAGAWRLVADLEIDEFSRGQLQNSAAELEEERAALEALAL